MGMAERWRVSFVCHEFPPFGGGAASALDALTRELVLRGHQVQVITVGPGRQVSEIVDLDGRRSVVRIGGGRQSSLTPTVGELIQAYVALRWRASELLDAFNPQVVIAFFAFPAGHAILPWHKKKGAPPLVAWFRGSDVPGFFNQRWPWFKPLHPLLVRRVMGEADLLLANGDGLARLATRFFPRRSVVALANGIDQLRYCPGTLSPTAGIPRFLAVGQLIPRKGLIHLLAGARWLAEQGREAMITLVGEGPMGCELAALAAQVPPPVTVVLAGYRLREEMPQVYQSHHVLVHLSQAEGVSNVLLEGLACGLPVIASGEAVTESGLSSPAVTVLAEVNGQRVGEALLTLLERRGQWEALGRQGREAALGFSWSATAEKLEALLAPLISEITLCPPPQ